VVKEVSLSPKRVEELVKSNQILTQLDTLVKKEQDKQQLILSFLMEDNDIESYENVELDIENKKIIFTLKDDE
jgi:hypothetical protein